MKCFILVFINKPPDLRVCEFVYLTAMLDEREVLGLALREKLRVGFASFDHVTVPIDLPEKQLIQNNLKLKAFLPAIQFEKYHHNILFPKGNFTILRKC